MSKDKALEHILMHHGHSLTSYVQEEGTRRDGEVATALALLIQRSFRHYFRVTAGRLKRVAGVT